MRVYNEFSGVEFDAWFESNPGEPTVPPSVHWRLRNLTADQTIQDWTTADYTITPDSSGNIAGVAARIDISGQLHRLNDPANRRETFELQVVSGKDTDREYSEVHEYGIVFRGAR